MHLWKISPDTECALCLSLAAQKASVAACQPFLFTTTRKKQPIVVQKYLMFYCYGVMVFFVVISTWCLAKSNNSWWGGGGVGCSVHIDISPPTGFYLINY